MQSSRNKLSPVFLAMALSAVIDDLAKKAEASEGKRECDQAAPQSQDGDDNVTVGRAMRVLTAEVKGDADYAWAWQSNIAVPLMDEGADWIQANKAAARVMANLFGVDMNSHPRYVGHMAAAVKAKKDDELRPRTSLEEVGDNFIALGNALKNPNVTITELGELAQVCGVKMGIAIRTHDEVIDE